MRRQALYSSSLRVPQATAAAVAVRPSRLSRFSASSPRLLWAAIATLAMLLAISLALGLRPGQRRLTQDDINAAVLKTLETETLPSAAARAAENIRPSIVRVVSYVKKSRLIEAKEREKEKESLPSKGAARPKGVAPGAKPAVPGNATVEAKKEEDEEVEHGVGTGVVIVDKGIILTNLHVVQGADRIMVTFSDGLEASAYIKGVQAEDDLAVLQASKIPDDLIAATMRSTSDLQPGDQVVAVGFPFGIGPSVSAGVISGLKRVFRSPEGKQEMKNLIQFDAAANPGNSGGPLVTMDGEVVGIVTAILNPTPARTFIGIAFAVPIENAANAAGLPPF
jgi:S1-C subfamily serine protease